MTDNENDTPQSNRAELLAEVTLMARFQAAKTIACYQNSWGEVDLTTLVKMFNECIEHGLKEQDQALQSQAIVLEHVFYSLMQKALNAHSVEYQALVIKLAFQAQSQALNTHQVLKNWQQQAVTTLTDGLKPVIHREPVPSTSSDANLENELNTANYDLKLDPGAAFKTSRSH